MNDMKTIEDAAGEYIRDSYDLDTFSRCNKYESAKIAFKDGVEFAQQWMLISSNPPKEREWNLFRSTYEGIYMYEVSFFFEGKYMGKNPKPTYWRPIEYKLKED